MPNIWKVTAYDGNNVVAEFTETLMKGSMIELMQCLASRHLTDREIIEGMAGRNALLRVATDANGVMMSGENPHYVAEIIG